MRCKEHSNRMDQTVRVESGPVETTYRAVWQLKSPPLVSLIVPTRDNREVLEPCPSSLLTLTDYPRFEVIVVDNGSSDGETLSYLESIGTDPRVTVLCHDVPYNFSAINNFAVSPVSAEIIGLINNDVEILDGDWLREMVSHAVRPEIGCVGAKLLYPDGTVQHGGVICGIGGIAGHSHKHYAGTAAGYYQRLQLVQNLSAVTAACLLVRRAVFEEVGGLNAQSLPIAFNDVDFCLRVRDAGYRNLWTPLAQLTHHESKSRGTDDTPAKQARFCGEKQYMRRTWGAGLR